ncbi:MAG: ABC transporter permease subunit, partial [Oricola sp.]|nr:ABC transporter permease subunit [Oricola sp.]
MSLSLLHLEFLLRGAAWTVGLSTIAMVGGGILGFIVALCRISPVWLVRQVSLGYVQIIQGTPLLVLMFLIFFGLPSLGLNVT